MQTLENPNWIQACQAAARSSLSLGANVQCATGTLRVSDGTDLSYVACLYRLCVPGSEGGVARPPCGRMII